MMMNGRRNIPVFILVFLLTAKTLMAQPVTKSLETDVLVVGGGTGGTAAGIQCARRHVKTVIVEPTTMLGGMLSAAGVSCTDGNDELPSGLWEAFRQALYKHYGTNQLSTGWVSNTCFEPHVADSIFKAWAAREETLTVFYGYHFDHVIKENNRVTGAVFNNADNERLDVKAKIVIDATELGDVFADAGADYDLGMDDPAETGEEEAVQKNDIIQDMTWSAILKDYGPGTDKTIPRPAGYDAKRYYCCNTDAPCKGKPWNGNTQKMLDYARLPNNKYMLNWPYHGNDMYLNVVEDDYATRMKNYALARQQTLGFLYFIQTKLGMKTIGLADDELDHGLALIPYNREGRRVKGVARFTMNHIKNPYAYTLYRTGIAVGDYPVDHHHAQFPGKVPVIHFPSIPSFAIPLGCLVPRNIEGLIVCEKGISVTNIVNGCTRLQPVVLLTGQAAGTLAALSVKGEEDPRNVPVRFLQQELLDDSCYLLPFSDVNRTDPSWKAVQRVGVTGILQGTGKPEGWANKMLFYPDSTLPVEDFKKSLLSFDATLSLPGHYTSSTTEWLYLAAVIGQVNHEEHSTDAFTAQAARLFQSMQLPPLVGNRVLTKKEIAVLLDHFCLPWILKEVDWNGNVLEENE
jgi:hypothetical protein